MHLDRQPKTGHAQQCVHLSLDVIIKGNELVEKLNCVQRCEVEEAIDPLKFDDPLVNFLPVLQADVPLCYLGDVTVVERILNDVLLKVGFDVVSQRMGRIGLAHLGPEGFEV